MAGALRDANQIPKGLLRSPPQFAAQDSLDQSAPPPGRQVKVSSEPDEGTSLGFGQADMLVILDAEWQAHEKVDPSALWVEVSDFDVDGPAPAKRSRGQEDLLAFRDRTRRF